MSNTFIPITSLPVLPSAPGIGMKMPIQAAGVTYKVDARAFPLPTDMLLTWSDQSADLPGSRLLMAGLGISFALSTASQLVISSSSSGQIVVLDQIVDAALVAPQEDWNPAGWAAGLSKNRLQVTPSSALLVGGLDSSSAVDGQLVALFNDSAANSLRLAHNSAGSSVANRFLCPGAATFALVPYQMVLLIKKGNSGWRFA